MWTGMMLLGLLAVFGLPNFTGDEDELQEEDDSVPDAETAPDTAGALGDEVFGDTDGDVPGDTPGESGGADLTAGDGPGVTVLEGFQPGKDTLSLSMPGDVTELTLEDGSEDAPASLAYTSAGDVTEIRFDGLETVPVDDISVLLDGDDEPMPLGAFLDSAEEDDALAPEDGETPTEPDDSGDDDPGLPPDDGEAPTAPDDSGDGDPGLPPDDGSLPTGALFPSELTALMARDGADPTGQSDPAGDVTETGPGDDTVVLPDDGAAGTGEGILVLSEAAALTGGEVIDFGDGDDTLVAGDGAAHAFGGAGDDAMAAGEGAQALYGGAGDDTLVMSSADEGTGGAGSDVFWIYPEDSTAEPAVITDFEPGEDFLRITLEHGTEGEVAVVPSGDGADMLVQIGSQTVAVLQGTTAASADDLYVETKGEIHA